MRPFATDVECSVVCVSVCVICAKTAEPIEMPFGRLTHVSPRNHILHSDSDVPFVTYLRLSAFCIVRLLPLANVAAQRTQQTCGLCQIAWDLCYFLLLFWYGSIR